MNQAFTSIHPEAKLHPSVVVEPFTCIHNNVEIDEGTWIGPNVTILEGARIGKNCRIFPGAVISAIPQDLKFNGEDSIVKIGDNTTIREFVTVNRGTKASGETVVGNDCLIMAYVHIAHDCQIHDNVVLANAVNLAGHIEIFDWAIVGGMSAVHQFVRIGAHSMIGGGSLVRKDVPPYIKAAREPLIFTGVNSIGLSRRGFSLETIRHIEKIYHIIYLKGLNVSHALQTLQEQIPPSPELQNIVEFIKSSSRGLIKGPGNNLLPQSDEDF
ncbi:MAG TPA: acyl-[acyl-carrier-protein]--UDP-N-acetylglucosamine O-acyltransferase [Bacteroidales bacterium]|nr:acyl-[acyl-carrier-protein]--UDP-N-acetylglucosamine O-acyltransferase [Bacteroidales bacterium]